jgi:hypothetical protein
MRLASLVLFAFFCSQSGASAATCYGNDPCNACHTCGYCKHCAVEGGTCGVCGGGTRRYYVNGKTIEISMESPAKQTRVCMIDGKDHTDGH